MHFNMYFVIQYRGHIAVQLINQIGFLYYGPLLFLNSLVAIVLFWGEIYNNSGADTILNILLVYFSSGKLSSILCTICLETQTL